MKKFISNLVWAIFLVVLLVALFSFLLGSMTKLLEILMVIGCIWLVINCLVTVGCHLIMDFIAYIEYRDFKKVFGQLKNLYAQRYKLYFSLNPNDDTVQKQIDEYSSTIQELGNGLLEAGKDCIETGIFRDRLLQEIESIMKQIQELLDKENS